MGRAVSKQAISTQDQGAASSEINLEEAGEQYAQFKKTWTDAYNALKNEIGKMESKKARAALETLEKSFHQVASLAAILQVENATLKQDMAELERKLDKVKEELQENEKRQEVRETQIKETLTDFQKQIDAIRDSLPNAVNAAKAADDLTNRVNMILSACPSSNFGTKYGAYSTAYF